MTILIVLTIISLNLGVTTAYPQETTTSVHPILGLKPPRETLNRDLAALPHEDRTAWLHGAFSQMAQVLAAKDAEAAKCVVAWYFEGGDGSETIALAIKTYPDYPATAIIYSAAKQVCQRL